MAWNITSKEAESPRDEVNPLFVTAVTLDESFNAAAYMSDCTTDKQAFGNVIGKVTL